MDKSLFMGPFIYNSFKRFFQVFYIEQTFEKILLLKFRYDIMTND